MIKKFGIVLAAAIAAGSFLMPARASTVGMELALVVDVSGSIDTTEFNLQMTGYKNAFNDAAVQNAIAGVNGGVAVALIEFDESQYLTLNWRVLSSATDASNFATAIGAAPRQGSGNTGVGDAIAYAANQILNANAYDGAKKVIDVSGDGSTNTGSDAKTAGNNAIAGGIDQINGLPILGSETNLDVWYKNNVQNGAGSFTLVANSFSDFDAAIKQKIVADITGVPLPPAVWTGLATIGLVGLAKLRRVKLT
ncbi:MAG TPA: DUF1194 domain-containing protein [Phycisphaerae bacterium]|nr:DUF1194 domain-containing protein [Phycisphaerae bacterium]